MSTPFLVPVVGIGADGLAGLAPRSLNALKSAHAIYGSPRQLTLVESLGRPLKPWPTPLLPALSLLFEEIAAEGAAILASGDPMFHGIGSTLARLVGASRLQVLPSPSSVSLAAARLGWSLPELMVHSCVSADPHVVLATARAGTRALVLARDAATPNELARVLVAAGLGASTLTVLSDLGGRTETRVSATADEYASSSSSSWTDLCIVAIEYHTGSAESGIAGGPAAGLPDAAFASDGQLTKRIVRAVTVCALDPFPGALLWDVGGGSGSIGIEWMRMAPGAQAIAVERDPARADRIRSNALRLGVPDLTVVQGTAPAVLTGLARPDAVFIGGGATAPGLLSTCWDTLLPGGRLVAASVTFESERVLMSWQAEHGGELTRIGVESASRIGAFTGWNPARPVVHLECVKPHLAVEETTP